MVEVAVSIEQEFISPCSPLQPLRNRFCLLNALGLPIRIMDADGTKTVNSLIGAIIFIPMEGVLILISCLI